MKNCTIEDCNPRSCDSCRETAKEQYKELIKKAREFGLSNKLCDTIASHRKMLKDIGLEEKDVQPLSQASQEDICDTRPQGQSGGEDHLAKGGLTQKTQSMSHTLQRVLKKTPTLSYSFVLPHACSRTCANQTKTATTATSSQKSKDLSSHKENTWTDVFVELNATARQIVLTVLILPSKRMNASFALVVGQKFRNQLLGISLQFI